MTTTSQNTAEKCGIYRKAALGCVDLTPQFQRLTEGFSCPLMGQWFKFETFGHELVISLDTEYQFRPKMAAPKRGQGAFQGGANTQEAFPKNGSGQDKSLKRELKTGGWRNLVATFW